MAANAQVKYLWDDILYPSFYSAIRGTIYGHITRDNIDAQCYDLAVKAIATFNQKWPRVSLDYETFYAIRKDENKEVLDLVDEDVEGAIKHGYFLNEITQEEIELLVAWMTYYWGKYWLSNADNFSEIYTSSEIKTYSRANAIDKWTKLVQFYRDEVRDLEDRYSRINAERRPSIGDINTED